MCARVAFGIATSDISNQHWQPTITDIQPRSAQEQQELFVNISSVSSPVTQGSYATLTARTLPSADCSITVHYKSGRPRINP